MTREIQGRTLICPGIAHPRSFISRKNIGCIYGVRVVSTARKRVGFVMASCSRTGVSCIEIPQGEIIVNNMWTTRWIGLVVVAAAIAVSALDAAAQTALPKVTGPIAVTSASFPFLAADRNLEPVDL